MSDTLEKGTVAVREAEPTPPHRWRPSRPTALVAVVLALALAAGSFWWLHRGLPDDVAVRVGETDVTVAELRDRMATLEALYGVTVPDGGDEEERFWRDAAQSVAVGLVLEDAVGEADVVITDNDVDQAVQQVVRSFFGAGAKGDSRFAEALADAGTSEDAVRDELRRQLEINALFATVTGDVEAPTDAEVADAYADRRCLLVPPDQRRIRNIVVPTRAAAKDALRRLRSGDAFAAVVTEVSIDASTRETGGDLGLVAATDLEDAYANAAFGVAEGGLFGPVQSEYGWNVGRVEDVRTGRVPAFDAVSDQLRQALFTETQSSAWRAWMREELKKAEVEYAAAYRPADPLALPADTTPGADSADAPSAADC